MKTRKRFLIFVVMLLFSSISSFGEIDGKTKTIYIKPITMLADGTVVNTSYDELSEELNVEAVEPAGEEMEDVWIDVVICKDGLEIDFASFNPFTYQLQFNMSDYGVGTYEVYTVSEFDAELIAVIEITEG